MHLEKVYFCSLRTKLGTLLRGQKGTVDSQEINKSEKKSIEKYTEIILKCILKVVLKQIFQEREFQSPYCIAEIPSSVPLAETELIKY